MKPLDLADKYNPLSYQDEYTEGSVDSTPTIRVQVPRFDPQVTVETQPEFDIWGERDTTPCPPPYPQPHIDKHPWEHVGLLMWLGFGLVFWSLVAYFIFR